MFHIMPLVYFRVLGIVFFWNLHLFTSLTTRKKLQTRFLMLLKSFIHPLMCYFPWEQHNRFLYYETRISLSASNILNKLLITIFGTFFWYANQKMIRKHNWKRRVDHVRIAGWTIYSLLLPPATYCGSLSKFSQLFDVIAAPHVLLVFIPAEKGLLYFNFYYVTHSREFSSE